MDMTLAEASVIFMIRKFDVFAYLEGTDRQKPSYTLSYTYDVSTGIIFGSPTFSSTIYPFWFLLKLDREHEPDLIVVMRFALEIDLIDFPKCV